MNNKIKNIIFVILIISFVVAIVAAIVHFRNKEDETNENYFSEISYDIPGEFELDEYSTILDYSYNDNGVYCYFKIHARKKEYYNDIENWFKENIILNLNDNISELSSVDVNGSKALYILKDSSGSKDYYYGFESNNYYYMITYSLYDYHNGDREDINTNLCDTTLEKVIPTIRIKK